MVAADDRTGAFEVAALFAAVAGPTLVAVGEPITGPCVVDIATRALSVDDAAARAATMEATPSGWSAHKIDSTLRGQWAAELRARQAAGGRRLVVLPAWPALGRTCVGGVVHVHGSPVGNVVEQMHDAALVHDAAALRAWLAGGGRSVVCDIPDEAALLAAAAVLAEADADVLVAGPAGPLGAVFTARSGARQRATLPSIDQPVLVVRGSANQVSVDQARRLQASGAAVTVVTAPLLADGVDLDVAVAEALADEARIVADSLQPRTVVLIGGDTAAAFLGDAPRLVGGSVAPGMPYSFDALGGGPLVVTKAGGFGPPDALVSLLSRRDD